MEEVDKVIEKHFPDGVDGADPETFNKAQQELEQMFKGWVSVEGECTWDSTRKLGDKLRCDIKVKFGAAAAT